MGAMGFSAGVEMFARILLIANGIAFFILEWSIVMKAKKLPDPEGYPPKDWDMFQRFIENKYFWPQLLIFLVFVMVFGYVVSM